MRIAPADVARCAGCGHGQLASMPAARGPAAGQREAGRRVLARVAAHAPPGEPRRIAGVSDLFAEPLASHEFDAVVLGDALAHLPRPDDALDRVAELLAPDGVVAVTSRRRWPVDRARLHHFTRSSLTLLLQRRGFTVLETGRTLVIARGPWPGE
jgi:2-polyprenyl-3-methyl-5-hydroxy-6-metoxy-1,4-benzoquinol methylase